MRRLSRSSVKRPVPRTLPLALVLGAAMLVGALLIEGVSTGSADCQGQGCGPDATQSGTLACCPPYSFPARGHLNDMTVPITGPVTGPVTELAATTVSTRTFLPLIGHDFTAPSHHHLGYGANIASADHALGLKRMGFNWAKGFVVWGDAGEGPGYSWVAVDNQLREFVAQVPNVLLRIGGPPPAGVGSPPVSAGDLEAFHDFSQALAVHISETWRIEGLRTIAFEIWNEPNLDSEWGGPPDAAQYTALLQTGYDGIRAGDPQAIVVSAGLATTGGSAEDLALSRRLYSATRVAPDLTFLHDMYKHGAKGHFDALGSHPFGGPDPAETHPSAASGPIYFRRAEEQHQVMLEYGDESPIWATEVGWVLESTCHLGEHEWMEVTEEQQAEYLVAAYAYAERNWLWMGPMFLFNLDFGAVFWYDRCDPVRWYSVKYREDPCDPGNSPVLKRSAFEALRDMPKHSAW